LKAILRALKNFVWPSLRAPASELPATDDPLLAAACPRGVHFFSAHDPISFLDAYRPEDLRTEFQCIRDDGFDTVCLLLPWHALFEHPDQFDLHPWYLERLLTLMDQAGHAGLKVKGRLFYAHSPVATQEAIRHDRQYALLHQPEEGVTRLGRQAQSLATAVCAHPAWAGALLTWEDFWPCFQGPPSWNNEARMRVGRDSGFSEWIRQQQRSQQAEELNLPCESGVWGVPPHNSPGMRLWIAFFDHVLRERVLGACAPHFPELGIEVRVDAYPVPGPRGATEWVHFDLFDDWYGPRYLYWGPFYGMANQGERISAQTAQDGLRHLLRRFKGQRRPIIDQFNFTDETLDFASHNARIRDDEMQAFISGSAELIHQEASGYWLWAYRDYRENWLVNPSFQRQGAAWEVDALDDVMFTTNPALAVLRPGARLSQVFQPEMRAQAVQGAYRDFQCDVVLDNPAHDTTLQALFDGQSLTGTWLASGELRFTIPGRLVNWQQARITLVNHGPHAMALRGVYFHGFVQRLRVRDEFGAPGPYLEPVRALNRALAGRSQAGMT